MAIAQGKWDGEPGIGLRWNGTAKAPISNPQARGLATCFILEKGRYADAIVLGLGASPRRRGATLAGGGRRLKNVLPQARDMQLDAAR
jgi:hypothetical protein